MNCTFAHNIWKAVLFSVYFKTIFHILQSSAQRYDRSSLQGNINKHVYGSQYIVRLHEIHKNLVKWTRDKLREQNLYNEDQRILGGKI